MTMHAKSFSDVVLVISHIRIYLGHERVTRRSRIATSTLAQSLYRRNRYRLQVLMLTFRLETIEEAKVILIFHVVGTIMEIFKTSVGSWIYPDPSFFRIGGVPLFTGFMYSCIGSYLCRVWRLFDFEFTNHPSRLSLVLLSAAIYINFFSHHFMPDLRWLLFPLGTVVAMAANGLLFQALTGNFWSSEIFLERSASNTR